MMEKDELLSMEETEQLCLLYMECRLSILEEAELQYVLGKVPYTSPVIEEVRTLMKIAICSDVEGKKLPPKNYPALKNKWKRRTLIIAASAAILFSIGLPVFLDFNREPDCCCQVFTNGKEVGRDKALIMAEVEMERIDRFFENMQSIEFEQQQKIESLK